MHVSLVLQHQAGVKRKESFSTRSTDKTDSLQRSLGNVRDVLKWLHSPERAAERLPLELIARYQLAVWERLAVVAQAEFVASDGQVSLHQADHPQGKDFAAFGCAMTKEEAWELMLWGAGARRGDEELCKSAVEAVVEYVESAGLDKPQGFELLYLGFDKLLSQEQMDALVTEIVTSEKGRTEVDGGIYVLSLLEAKVHEWFEGVDANGSAPALIDFLQSLANASGGTVPATQARPPKDIPKKAFKSWQGPIIRFAQKLSSSAPSSSSSAEATRRMTTGGSHIDMPDSAQGDYGAGVERADQAALEAFKAGDGPFNFGWLASASPLATPRLLLVSNHDGSHETVVHNLLGYERVIRLKPGFAPVMSAALAAKERRVRTSGGIFWQHYGTLGHDEVSIPFDGAFMGRKVALEAAAAQSIARAQAMRVAHGLPPAASTDRWSIDASRFKVDEEQMDKEKRVKQAGGFACQANYEARVAEVDYYREQLELSYTELEARGVEHFTPVLTGRLEDGRPPLSNFAFESARPIEFAHLGEVLLTSAETGELDGSASELELFVGDLEAHVRCAEVLQQLERADMEECEATRPADRGEPPTAAQTPPSMAFHLHPAHPCAPITRTRCALTCLALHHTPTPTHHMPHQGLARPPRPLGR